MICSEIDRNSYFARNAEALVVIGPAPARDSYLSIEKIINAALDNECDSVHPGYGFLSENASFARACRDAGLIFIGPTPESIDILGSKTEARKKVQEFSVPCVPGAIGGLSDTALIARAKEVGFPIIIKAVAGGGGRGMRVCQTIEEMTEALPLARGEAMKNFSSEDVFFERFIELPRHVEVQVFGDTHGNVVHFGTRDCSAQRRHQKLVEEAPAPGLPPAMREKIHTAAVRAAESVGYVNAGTAEFLVKGEEFYFLEMNTRIQVEHPVTEEVTGVDLVELQFRVARGEPIPMKQSEISFSGHAMEFRIYAEDPGQNFSPSKGKIAKWIRPRTPAFREDYAFEEGDEVSLFYDAMMSKVIVKGESRERVIRDAYELLQNYKISGIKTNIEFHRWLLLQPEFRRDHIDIGFIERTFTPACLDELRTREVRDPLHQPPVSGALVKEFFEVDSFTIEVVHEAEGTFLASVVDAQGRRSRGRWARRSNGRAAAIASLVSEVLEQVPSGDIFND